MKARKHLKSILFWYRMVLPKEKKAILKEERKKYI